MNGYDGGDSEQLLYDKLVRVDLSVLPCAMTALMLELFDLYQSSIPSDMLSLCRDTITEARSLVLTQDETARRRLAEIGRIWDSWARGPGVIGDGLHHTLMTFLVCSNEMGGEAGYPPRTMSEFVTVALSCYPDPVVHTPRLIEITSGIFVADNSDAARALDIAGRIVDLVERCDGHQLCDPQYIYEEASGLR